MQSLDILRRRVPNPVFRAALDDIYEKVRSGTALSEAFEAQKLFSGVYTASLMAGEKSGSLEQVIRRYVQHIKVLTLGAIAGGLGAHLSGGARGCCRSVVVGLIVFKVVPEFADFYKQFGHGAELPLSTRVVVAISTNLVGSAGVIFAAARSRSSAARCSGSASRRSAGGCTRRSCGCRISVRWHAQVRDRAGRRGRWRRCSRAAFRSSTRSTSRRESVEQPVDRRSARRAWRRQVREGGSLATALAERDMFPHVAVEMVEVGESTGALADMLNSVADFYDEENETSLTRFSNLMQPVLLIVMGVVIAGLLLSLYMPLFKLSSLTEARSMAEPTTATDRHALRRAGDARRSTTPPRRSRRARLAARYQLEFVDLEHFHIDHALFRSIPGRSDAALRLRAVPPRRPDAAHRRVRSERPADDRRGRRPARARRSACASARRRRFSRSSRRARARSACSRKPPKASRCRSCARTRAGDENLTVDKLTSDASPVIRLVDSMVFTALQRRASDIHIETQDDAVHVKYRIDGVLQQAMKPIDKRHHSTIISRIKVMAELDIAEKRVPQDGRFKLRVRGKTIDFRVSIMPSVHGEDAVIRILDKESMSEQFTELRLDILGWPEDRDAAVPEVHPRAVRHGARHRARPAAARRRRSTRRCRRSRRSKTRSSRSKTRSNTSCAASRRFRSTRRRA